jgi:hypothetical protein
LRPTILPQKGGKNLGIKNWAQLPLNKKSTPGGFIQQLKMIFLYSLNFNLRPNSTPLKTSSFKEK